MEPLYLEATKDTPEVVLDPGKNIFRISQRSLPENANKFYQPIIEWISFFSDAPQGDIYFDFMLDYINTSSSKQITKILLLLEYMANKVKITIRWHYRRDDKDMLLTGERFAKLIKVNFEFFEM
ncbi:MAG: hypothetical protein A2275_16205 [Bacteroidetes bacterium RIFOXYA12_FULL_35_11]|nr:MAG: hypothetical protein A2X01_16600 [Bacteroidetes bacterium GWF2_35_48]OFY75790.1 MAG: hypothetical protein A2275_16205 [Bacteroidetes bacterium RIFOXYA12_FULL_35_11]OFY97335.1 MAG: hypothetical protein A2309_03765 [Bacteroidetes bacterium RIFOXYB2_FULL_35_7]OFY98853.1 MAG: hypothetical protein A2491_15510 [Bacteroidetes bacterium RIFOXYC12_FULL_35_7]HBX53417.1 nuclear pore complex subunit [Bacteroidales bacterium]